MVENTTYSSELPVAVIVLTYNEERNIRRCLTSVLDDFCQAFVVDSNSTDRTREIASEQGASVVGNPWPGYAAQRNWALDNLPIEASWVFFLDADEHVTPEFVAELREKLAGAPEELHGFLIARNLVWLGKELRHGGFGKPCILRVFRRGYGRCDDRAVNEHIRVEGKVAAIRTPIVHRNDSGLERWWAKHVQYAKLEARSLLNELIGKTQAVTEHERERLRLRRFYATLPPFFRSFARYVHRMTVLGGIRDGLAGLSYHTLQGLCYPLLTDVYFVREAFLRLFRISSRSKATAALEA